MLGGMREGCKVSFIYEKSKLIPIPAPTPGLRSLASSNDDARHNNNVTYSLKQNCFDPTKMSPPNEFMLKLQKRMSLYESLEIKDDKRNKV